MNKNNQQSGCFVSTGQKQVLHTLWAFDSTGDYFIKNLPVDKEEAIKKAKKWAEENECPFDTVIDSPHFGRGRNFEMYGVQFKNKRKKGKLFYQGYPTPEFWEEWKKNKDVLKEQGFRVTKYINPYDRDRKIIWYVFYKPLED